MTIHLITLGLLLGGLVQVDQNPRIPGGYLMDFKVVASGDRGNAVDKDFIVIRNSDQWESIRTKVGVTDEKNAEIRELHGALGTIDWGREQVVFARAAQQRTGGYQLGVQRVTRFSNSWRIDLVLQSPGKDVMTTEALTTPFVLFKTRRTSSTPTIIVHNTQAK